MRSSARRESDDYVLNGSKRFITNAGVAQLYTVLHRCLGRCAGPPRHADAAALARAYRASVARSCSRSRWPCSPTRSGARTGDVAFGVWGAITGLAVAIGPAARRHPDLRAVLAVDLLRQPADRRGRGRLTVARVSESRDPAARRPDWAGFATFTLALACLVYGLIESNQRSFSDGLVIGCLVGRRRCCSLAFVLVEMRIASPMFDLSLFRLPTFSGGSWRPSGSVRRSSRCCCTSCSTCRTSSASALCRPGVRLLVTLGRRSSYVGHRRPVDLARAGAAAHRAGPGADRHRTAADAWAGRSSTWTHLLPGLIVAGVGVGWSIRRWRRPPSVSSPARAGMASGINSTFRQVGIATGIALLGTLFSNRLAAAVTDLTAGAPLGSRSGQISTALRNGGAGKAYELRPAPGARPAGRGGQGQLRHRPG